MTARRRGRPVAGPLTGLFSSAVLPELVALLDRLGTLAIDDLASRAGVSRVTVSKEVKRLTELGIVTVAKIGNRRLVSLADTPSARAVRNLAVLACGVPEAVSAEFAGLPNVDHLYIYGSWAARHAGEHGRLPGDIDVLAIGSVDRDELFEAAERAAQRIGIPVSARRITPSTWHGGQDPFVRAVRDRPLLEVDM